MSICSTGLCCACLLGSFWSDRLHLDCLLNVRLCAGPLENTSGIVTGPGGLPSLDQRIRRIASDPTSRHNSRNVSGSSLRGAADNELLRQVPMAQSTNTIDELVSQHSSALYHCVVNRLYSSIQPSLFYP